MIEHVAPSPIITNVALDVPLGLNGPDLNVALFSASWIALVELVMPLVSVNAPVLPAIDDTDPADDTDDTVANLSAPDAAWSWIGMRSLAAGEAFWVSAPMVENCGAAEPDVKLPSMVKALALACLPTVIAELATVNSPPAVIDAMSPLAV